MTRAEFSGAKRMCAVALWARFKLWHLMVMVAFSALAIWVCFGVPIQCCGDTYSVPFELSCADAKSINWIEFLCCLEGDELTPAEVDSYLDHVYHPSEPRFCGFGMASIAIGASRWVPGQRQQFDLYCEYGLTLCGRRVRVSQPGAAFARIGFSDGRKTIVSVVNRGGSQAALVVLPGDERPGA